MLYCATLIEHWTRCSALDRAEQSRAWAEAATTAMPGALWSSVNSHAFHNRIRMVMRITITIIVMVMVITSPY